jgi:hypothetical protein
MLLWWVDSNGFQPADVERLFLRLATPAPTVLRDSGR